jgi:hypothetical protein
MSSPEISKSHLQRAASLPSDAPHVLEVDNSIKVPESGAARIGIDEFEDALRDPKRKDFIGEAKEYGRQLESEGRIIKNVESVKPSRVQRVRQAASDIWQIIKNTDEGDIVRGISQF